MNKSNDKSQPDNSSPDVSTLTMEGDGLAILQADGTTIDVILANGQQKTKLQSLAQDCAVRLEITQNPGDDQALLNITADGLIVKSLKFYSLPLHDIHRI